MTLTIDLSEELEARLRTAARAKGTDEAEAARQVLESALPAAAAQDLTPAERAEDLRLMFERWAAEDAARTPEERAAEDAKWVEIDRDLEEGLALRDVDVSDFE
jgi:hypothetical protein